MVNNENIINSDNKNIHSTYAFVSFPFISRRKHYSVAEYNFPLEAQPFYIDGSYFQKYFISKFSSQFKIARSLVSKMYGINSKLKKQYV